MRGVADTASADPRLRAWANVKRAELLYNNSQQQEYTQKTAAREELLDQAINCHQQAIQIGEKYPKIVGQATIGIGLCYENLGKPLRALEQYEKIIAQASQTYKGSIWLTLAQNRKAFLERMENEKMVFQP